MDKKSLVKKVVKIVKEALGKEYVDRALIEPIKKIVSGLNRMSNENEIKEGLLQFFEDQKLDTEKQAYVIMTLVQTYDLHLKSPAHKKVLKDLAKGNSFVDIMF